jgi:hypothetical protein
MSEWSLPVLLERFHRDIEHKLETARAAFAHSGTKGDASEEVWLEMLREYLPRRYTSLTKPASFVAGAGFCVLS